MSRALQYAAQEPQGFGGRRFDLVSLCLACNQASEGHQARLSALRLRMAANGKPLIAQLSGSAARWIRHCLEVKGDWYKGVLAVFSNTLRNSKSCFAYAEREGDLALSADIKDFTRATVRQVAPVALSLEGPRCTS